MRSLRGRPIAEYSFVCLQPHIEGLLAQGQQGLDVGDKLKAKLIRTDIQHGYIDFARA